MESLWQKTVQMPSFPQLEGDIRTDVLLIGGGMAGLLTAYLLQQSGVNCILIEKGKICQGTTGGTTAKITVQHGLIYHKLLRRGGFGTAQCYLQANQMAFDEYKKLCGTIDCDYIQKENYVYSLQNRNSLEKELAALQKIGCKAKFCETLPLPFPTAGAVMVPGQAQFHPLKFAAAIAKDLPIYENTWATELRGTQVVTNAGRITADQILVMTHFPFLNTHGSYFFKLYQHRSYVLALEQAGEIDGMFVSDSKTGLSFRQYQQYLLLSGGGHRTGTKGGTWTELRRFAKQNYPQAKEFCAWSAQDCMSLDDVPYIGQYSARTRKLYAATGFHKWGMTGSMLSALLLRDAVLEHPNAFAQVFSPSRSMLRPQLLINSWETTKNLLTFSKKRCPHLGCALKWNPAEHSWDCPCHGSRFQADGQLLDNPANGHLNLSD